MLPPKRPKREMGFHAIAKERQRIKKIRLPVMVKREAS
jgi:hypothetical protein